MFPFYRRRAAKNGRLIRAEAGLDYQGEGGFEAQAGGDEGLEPELVKLFGVILGLGEKVIESFELPTALEIFASQALAEFFNESLGFFGDHGVRLSLFLFCSSTGLNPAGGF
jgi:hypothetical protein